MILNIETTNEQEELLKNFLKENNIEFETYLSPLHMFFEEEAEFRIRLNYADKIENKEELDILIEKHSADLAASLFDNEYVFNFDLMDELTREVVENI